MNFSDDIILIDKDICFYFKYLDWDSDFFDTPSYLLDMGQSNLSVSKVIQKEIEEKLKGCFVTVKIDTSLDYTIVSFLQECGFTYIDTEVVLEYKKQNNIRKKEDIIIEKIKVNVGLPYQELGSSFSLTRFHSDIYISDKKANSLWINYISNYTITPRNHIFVAKKENDILGAIIVNLIDDIAYIFFIGILKDYQCLGVGSSLINEVINYFNKYTIRTGTQVKNINALNFYIKNSFLKVNQTNTILHYWS